MASHAVVLGGSLSGLATARALSSHFDRVTIVERDELPTKVESRKGVPQGNHAHGLLASGYRVLDDYFPGMMDELVAAGASKGDVTGDFLWYQFGAWKLREDIGLGGIVVTRPCLETKVREKVRALKNVEILTGHDIEEPIFEKRVIGARIKNRSTDERRVLDADLVVDASGRGSRAPQWLEKWGMGSVLESVIKCNIGYTTFEFARNPGEFRSSIGGVIIGAPPKEKRGGACFAVEGNRWVVTLFGALGDHAPTDLAGYREFARSLPQQDIYELVRDREPINDVQIYKFAANQRRHYEKINPFPEGFLVLGDAMCSFNPVYGQGMSVALLEARALDDLLRVGRNDLAKRYFARANSIIEIPWTIATGEDLRYPEVEGARPPGFSVINKYMERAHHAATIDVVVLKRFFEVANLLRAPTAMLSPEIAYRVLLGGRRSAPPPAPR